MRTVTITIEEDSQSKAAAHDHDLECIMALNGRHYHNALRDVCKILIEYDNKKSLTKAQKSMLQDIREKCAEHFRSVYHEKRR